MVVDWIMSQAVKDSNTGISRNMMEQLEYLCLTLFVMPSVTDMNMSLLARAPSSLPCFVRNSVRHGHEYVTTSQGTWLYPLLCS